MAMEQLIKFSASFRKPVLPSTYGESNDHTNVFFLFNFCFHVTEDTIPPAPFQRFEISQCLQASCGFCLWGRICLTRCSTCLTLEKTSLSLPTPSAPPEKAATGVSRPKATFWCERRRGRQTLRRPCQIGSSLLQGIVVFCRPPHREVGRSIRLGATGVVELRMSDVQLWSPTSVCRHSRKRGYRSLSCATLFIRLVPHFCCKKAGFLVRRISDLTLDCVSTTSKSSASGVNSAGKRRRVYARALNLTTEWRLLWEQWSQRGFAADDRHLVLAPWFLAR